MGSLPCLRPPPGLEHLGMTAGLGGHGLGARGEVACGRRLPAIKFQRDVVELGARHSAHPQGSRS